jgi:hypothetical protein
MPIVAIFLACAVHRVEIIVALARPVNKVEGG